VSDRLLRQRNERGADACVRARVLARELRRNRRELGSCAAERRARPQPASYGQVRGPSRSAVVVVEDIRLPDLALRGEAEGAWHDADDRSRNTVERQLSADHLGVGVEATPPDVLADDDDSVPAGGEFLWREGPTDQRPDAERLEEALADEPRPEVLRTVGTEVVHTVRVRGGECRERPLALAPVEEVRRRDVLSVIAFDAVVRPDSDDPVRLMVWEWREENTVDRAEDRCRSADTDGERQHDDGSEARPPAQAPHSIAHIAEKVLERADAADVAAFVLVALDAAEGDHRAPASFVRRDTARNEVRGLHLDVESHLVVHLALETTRVKKILNEAHHDYSLLNASIG
jgi:hypothetical protein